MGKKTTKKKTPKSTPKKKVITPHMLREEINDAYNVVRKRWIHEKKSRITAQQKRRFERAVARRVQARFAGINRSGDDDFKRKIMNYIQER